MAAGADIKSQSTHAFCIASFRFAYITIILCPLDPFPPSIPSIPDPSALYTPHSDSLGIVVQTYVNCTYIQQASSVAGHLSYLSYRTTTSRTENHLPPRSRPAMSSDDGRVEKRGGGAGDGDLNEGHAEALHRFRSAASIAMSPELFEKLYLSPENRVHGDLRRTFGNPTPMCVLSRCGNLHALLKRLAWARSFPCLTRDQLTLACEQWPRRLPPLPHALIHGPHGLARRRRQRRREHVS